MSTAVRGWLTVMLLLLGAYGGYTLYRVARANSVGPAATATGTVGVPEYDAMNSAPARSLESFHFTERSGKPVSLGELKGDVWVASFFFASCPGFCAQMNQALAGMKSELKEKGVKLVSITVDPENDTPERLTAYADKFQADPNQWMFLTGTLRDAQSLGKDVFHVVVLGKEHSDRLIVVDRAGHVRGTYHSLDTAQLSAFRKKLDRVLAEPKPADMSAKEKVAAKTADTEKPSTAERSTPHGEAK